MKLRIPDPVLVLLIGPSGAGKSTFAAAHFKPTEIVSSDALRELLTNDAGDQGASSEAFRLVALIVNGRLSRRLTTVIDATNLRSVDRRRYQSQASKFGVPTVAVAFDLPLAAYHARNQARTDRYVSAGVVDDQAARMPQTFVELSDESHSELYVLSESDLLDGVTVDRNRGS